ncbi:hypothetical protein [Corynebacterium epidermidicanis]|uniref:Uncharacterized protein n=1 Tax=Corynebacterium epidermidicanis TaxID=1050174 RepID=A0A0G3GSK2_9CORY|nr:hypothetical protein [Corynebacterium epidermidicanis]AKK02538.1 hypothetical protein CEPID_03290 [Corynebacterium epidermidicanis]
MSYSPIPGYTLLMTLTPPPEPPLAPEAPPELTRTILGIVQVALEAAFGMRDVTSLPKNRFAQRLRTQITAFLRSGAPRGPVRLQRIAHQGAQCPKPRFADPLAIRVIAAMEVHGAAIVGEKNQKTFAGRLEMSEGKRQWVLVSLRVF